MQLWPLHSLEVQIKMILLLQKNKYIFHSDKCNTELDCIDKSDETYCDYLKYGDDYAESLVPRDKSGDPTFVYMNVSILAFPHIDVINLKFTADYYLSLRWYDYRITYLDLNNMTILNSINEDDMNNIWTPDLGFTNALGPFQTKVDELTHGVLVKESNPLDEDLSLYNEAMLFAGANNSVLLVREYYIDYGCNSFNLIYYPFDTQMCTMVFEVQGKTDDYVQLKMDHQGVEFTGLPSKPKITKVFNI